MLTDALCLLTSDLISALGDASNQASHSPPVLPRPPSGSPSTSRFAGASQTPHPSWHPLELAGQAPQPEAGGSHQSSSQRESAVPASRNEPPPGCWSGSSRICASSGVGVGHWQSARSVTATAWWLLKTQFRDLWFPCQLVPKKNCRYLDCLRMSSSAVEPGR